MKSFWAISGVRCSWFTVVLAEDVTPTSCPYCGGPVFVMAAYDWWNRAIDYERAYGGYMRFLTWLQGKPCYRPFSAAIEAYNAHLDEIESEVRRVDVEAAKI